MGQIQQSKSTLKCQCSVNTRGSSPTARKYWYKNYLKPGPNTRRRRLHKPCHGVLQDSREAIKKRKFLQILPPSTIDTRCHVWGQKGNNLPGLKRVERKMSKSELHMDSAGKSIRSRLPGMYGITMESVNLTRPPIEMFTTQTSRNMAYKKEEWR